MTLQNRVDPWGEIHASPERGTMMGNRGGRFHRDDRTLGTRRWASRHWICCELHYKNMHHEPMGEGYTSLFFLDEVTALAAGHRPCFFCRRKEAKEFLGERKVEEFDGQLHAERVISLTLRRSVADGASKGSPREDASRLAPLAPQHEDVLNLPDGAMIEIDGNAFAVRGDCLLRWSFAGYTERLPCNPSLHGRLLTCASIAAILRGGYKPRWHESAHRWGTP
jgi:hypothetical protein